MRKVLIFGSTGMIGHVVYNYLASLNKYRLIGSTINNKISEETILLDIRNSEKIKDYLKILKPDYVINCAGLLIAESEGNVEDALLINSLFPNVLSRLGKKLNFKLIQMSTDCVFSGKKGNYTEESVPDGNNIYARTKMLGEINNKRDLTIRTSTIGPELKINGTGLLHWFLKQRGKINGFDNVFWTGVTTLELAKAIDEFIIQDISGLYHLVPKNKISKYELLKILSEVWGRDDIEVCPCSDYPLDKSLLNSRQDFNYPTIDYKEMIVELQDWVLSHQDLYSY
jgi:dTDP-4-dehydrorhamnose reductase